MPKISVSVKCIVVILVMEVERCSSVCVLVMNIELDKKRLAYLAWLLENDLREETEYKQR